jgi:uncharacterized membrane protein
MMPVREVVDTWASIYANSATLRSGVAFTHVGALLSGGGCAIAADLGTLKAWRAGAESLRFELRRLHHVHRTVMTSLTLVVVSGLLLTAADLDAYLASTAFWTKMALVCALVANGAVLLSTCARAESGDARAARHLRVVSVASLVLWFATTLMGAVLPNAL